MQFPERFGDFINEKNMLEIFGPLKEAAIEKTEQQTRWGMDKMNIPIPADRGLREYLGPPTSERNTGDRLILSYLYELKQSGDQKSGATRFHMIFTLPGRRQLLEHADTLFGRLEVEVDVRPDQGVIRMKRR